MKPKLFIGSSTEGLDIAYAIQSQLTNDAECTVWKNAFPLGSYTLSATGTDSNGTHTGSAPVTVQGDTPGVIIQTF